MNSTNQSMSEGQSIDNAQKNIISSKKRGWSGWSHRMRVLSVISGLAVITMVGFGGYSLWQNLISDAAGEEYLGDVSITKDAQVGLREAPETALFSLKAENVSLKDASGPGVTATSPYPGDGLYRIASSKEPMSEDTWSPIYGTEVKKVFDADNSKWTSEPTPRYEVSGGRKISGEEKPGDRIHYRAEMWDDSASEWVSMGEVISFELPAAKLSVKLPSYTDIARYYRPEGGRVDALQNPTIIVTWTGNGDGQGGDLRVPGPYYSGYPHIQAAASPDMSNNNYELKTSLGDEYIYSDIDAVVGQTPGTTQYYAIYGYSDRSIIQLSNILEIKTPFLGKAPEITLVRQNDTIVDGAFYADRELRMTYTNSSNPGASDGAYEFTSRDDQPYIWERSIRPDGKYVVGDTETKQFVGKYSLEERGGSLYSDVKQDTAYYYRVKPMANNGVWSFSNQEWSQVLKVDPNKSASVYTYPAPVIGIGDVTHDTLAYSVSVASADARGIEVQISSDNKTYKKIDTVQASADKVLDSTSGISANKTYYLRAAYYSANTASNRTYTTSVSVKTKTDPTDASYLSCALTVPTSIKRGQKLTANVVVKNATGTSTYTGGRAVDISFANNGKTFETKTPADKLTLGPLAPGLTTSKSLTATVKSKAAKGKKKIKVTAKMTGAPKTGSCAKTLVKYVQVK